MSVSIPVRYLLIVAAVFLLWFLVGPSAAARAVLPVINVLTDQASDARDQDLKAKERMTDLVADMGESTTAARDIASERIAKAARRDGRTEAVQDAWNKARTTLNRSRRALEAKAAVAYGSESPLLGDLRALGAAHADLLVLGGWGDRPGQPRYAENLRDRMGRCRHLIDVTDLDVKDPDAWCRVLGRHDAGDTYRQRFETLAAGLDQRREKLIRKIDGTPTRHLDQPWPLSELEKLRDGSR